MSLLRDRSTRRALWSGMFLLALLSLFLVRFRAVPEEDDRPLKPFSVEEDTGVQRWLTEAAQHEKAGRWREALVLYRRAQARNPDHLCPVEGSRGAPCYAGIGEFVVRRVSKYPAEGIEAYRAEYEALAQGIWESYRKDQRREHLETIVDSYFFTTLGDDAAHLLATRLYDEGRVAEAAYYWDRILRYYPSPSVSRGLCAARRLTARRLLRDAGAEGDPLPRLDDASVRVAGAPAAVSAAAESIRAHPLSPRWAAIRKGASRLGDAPALRQWLDLPDLAVPLSNDLRLWPPYQIFGSPRAEPVPSSDDRRQRLLMARMMGMQGQGKAAYSIHAATHRDEDGHDTIIVQDGHRIVALDTANGRLLWRNPPSNPSVNRQMLVAAGIVAYACVRDGNRVYANMVPANAPPRVADGGPFGGTSEEILGPRTLRCYDIPSGRLVWDSFELVRDRSPATSEAKREKAGRTKDAGFDRMVFPSPVAVGGGRVYAAGLVQQSDFEVYLCAFRAETGALLWKRFLCAAPSGGSRWRGEIPRVAPCVAEAGGIVYCLTNLGAVAALHGATGEVLWLAPYPSDRLDQNPSPSRVRPINPPAVSGSRLVIFPQDAAKLFIYDAPTGALEETFADVADCDYFHGIHLTGVTERKRTVILSGKRVLFIFIDAPAGGANRFHQGTWPSEMPPPVARGVADSGTLYLPSRRGLVRYDLGTLRLHNAIPAWADEADAGALAVADAVLVSATGDRIAVYTDLNRFAAQEEAALARTPPHPQAFLQHGQRLFESRRYTEAMDVLMRAAALLEAGRPPDDPLLASAREKICLSACEQAEILITQKVRLSAALDILRRARPHARREDLEALCLFLTARAQEALMGTGDRPDRRPLAAAMQAYQEVIERLPDAMVDAEKAAGGAAVQDDVASRRVLAGRLAAEMLAELIESHGRENYRPIEGRARQALTVALPPHREDSLAAVVARYPHSEAAWEATRQRAALHPPGPAGAAAAAAAWEAYLHDGAPGLSRRALAYLQAADAWETADRPDRQRIALDAARRIAPDAQIPAEPGSPPAAARDVRAAVEARRAKLRPLPSPPDPPDLLALKKDSPPCRMDLIPAPGTAIQAIVPESSACEARFPLPSNRLLLARGSALILWDLDKKEELWRCPCPKGATGFELTDDPAAGKKDGVFVYPGPRGKPAEKAGLADGDTIVRIDGVPVSPEDTRRLLARILPGVPIKLDLLRGDKPLSVTLVPDPWPEDREPNVLPDATAWLPDGSLAVAWKDRVAVVAPGEAAPRWVYFPPGNDRIVLDGLLASRRHLFVRYSSAEAPKEGEEADEIRARAFMRRGMMFGGRAARFWAHRSSEGAMAHSAASRVAGLDAVSGHLLWERSYTSHCATDPSLPDRVFASGDLLVRVLSVVSPSAATDPNADSDDPRQGSVQHVVEVIDGRSGRRIGPSAVSKSEMPVVGMALDPRDGWLATVRAGTELHIYDLLARLDCKPSLRLGPASPRGSSDGVDVVLAAGWGRIAVGHRQGGVLDVFEPGKDKPLRSIRLSELVSPETTPREIDPATPNAIAFDGPDHLIVYNVDAKRKGHLAAIQLSGEKLHLWETVETAHHRLDGNQAGGVCTVILPSTARYMLKYDPPDGVILCFDKTRTGAYADKLTVPSVSPNAPQTNRRVLVRGEQVIVETAEGVKVYRQ